MSSDSLSYLRANYISLWVETLLYGVFLVFFVLAIYALIWKKSNGRVNIIMVVASTLVFMLVTAHLICDLVRGTVAFTTPGGEPAKFFLNIAHPSEFAKILIYYLLTVSADSILLYRCWIVWGKSIFVMVLPIIIYLADIAAGACALSELARVKPHESIFVHRFGVWALAFFATTVSVNMICTLLIAGKIYHMNRKVAGVRQTGGTRIINIAIMLIESAAIYSTILIPMIVLYALEHNAQFITLDAIPPIIGIVFEMIIVRIGLGLSDDPQRTLTTIQSGSQGRSQSYTDRHRIPLDRFKARRPVDITVDTIIESDDNYKAPAV